MDTNPDYFVVTGRTSMVFILDLIPMGLRGLNADGSIDAEFNSILQVTPLL